MGDFFESLAGTKAYARQPEIADMPGRDDGVPVAKSRRIQEADLRPGGGGSLGQVISRHVGVVLDVDVCEKHALRFKTRRG